MPLEIEKLPKNTYRAAVTISQDKVKEALTAATNELSTGVEVPGFRKGKAPSDLAGQKLDPKEVQSRALEKLLNERVTEIIKEHHLHPITHPRVEIKKYEPESDLVFNVIFVERPEVKIGDYKAALAKLELKKEKTIYGPGGEPVKGAGSNAAPDDAIGKVIDAALAETQAEIAEILVDEEVNQMLSRLIDQTAKVGLTVEEYLKSQNKTIDQLKAEYRLEGERTLKIGIMLSELAALEGIKVGEADIDATISAAPDDESRQRLTEPEARLYISTVLRNNKIVRRLMEIAEGTETPAGISL